MLYFVLRRDKMILSRKRNCSKKLIFSVLCLFCLFVAVSLYAQSKDKIKQAKSKEVVPKARGTCSIVADVFDGFGGDAQSDNSIMQISSGGQPSPIGISQSTANKILAGYVYASGWPTITVISPTGGEIWCVDSLVCIVWTSFSLPGDVKIELSTNSGSSWDTELTDSTPNDGEYCFPCPDVRSDNCRVKISDTSSGYVYGESEHDFTIYLPGDVDQDGVIELGDVLYLISYLYKLGPAPDPLVTGDVNCDGIVDLGDVLYLISYLYKGGPPPLCCSNE